MSRPLQQMPKVSYSVTRLGGGVTSAGVAYPGGLDLTTPSLALQPGALRDCLNFECSQSGGYARISGYERYDGQASPSTATYIVVQVDAFTNVPVVGNTITQATSGATGVVVAVSNVVSAYYVAVTSVTGAFDYTHAISVGATPIGTAITPMVAVSSLLNAQYIAAAADVYRALIAKVPGSGDILGVVAMVFSGTDYVYAFRANAGGTAVDIYKSTAAGWVQVPLYKIVSFSAGAVATPADGATLTQGGVTATIKRVQTASGAWTGTAAGTFVITTPAGGNFAGGGATISGGATVTLSGIQTAITLLPGGHFEFVKCNFSGQVTTRRIYGCDGVNKAFEFDGDVLAPITTGLSPDTPSHIAFHKNFLFLSQSSSIIYCEVGLPFRWATGGEIATGDVVNAMISLPGAQDTAAMAVYMASNTAILYGTSASTFSFVIYNVGTGALAYSVQNLFDTMAFDHLGVVTLRATLNFGNFSSTALTKNILPFILQERAKTCSSSVSRDKSQYRVFFNDGYGLWLTIVNQQYVGAGLVLFPDPVLCIDEDDAAAGGEVTYFGSSSGYVFQQDVGNSFDGAAIDAHITLAWDALKSPRVLKRFRRASIEMQGTGYAAVQFGYQLGYGSPNIGQPSFVTYPTGFAGTSRWDVGITWDVSGFVWDGQTLLPTDVGVTGAAENIQITIASGSNYVAAYNVNSVIHHYTMRRGIR